MSQNLDKLEQARKSVGLILKDLLKVIKVVSMYPEDNPLPQSLKRSFAEQLADLSEHLGGIEITVEKEHLNYKNEEVYHDHSKEDRLAGLFFETGITDFCFKPDIDVFEIYRLLDVIRIYVNTPDKDHANDLVTMIWEAEITNFSFGTIEDVALARYDDSFNVREFLDQDDSRKRKRPGHGSIATQDYVSIFEPGSGDDDSGKYTESAGGAISGSDSGEVGTGVGSHHSGPSFAGGGSGQAVVHTGAPEPANTNFFDSEGFDEVSLRTVEAAEAMGFTQLPSAEKVLPKPDTTLILNDEFKLSEEEEKIIIELVEADAEFEPYESTLELVKELLLQESDMQAFYETVTIAERIVSEFLLAGRLLEAGKLLQYIKSLDEKLHKDKPLWAKRLSDAFVTAGSRERMMILADALNARPAIGSGELNRYLENFGWEALGPITDLLGAMEHQQHRECLTNYLSLKGKDNIEIVAKGIYDKRWHVVRNSVAILTQINDSRALKHLAKVVKHQDPQVRLEMVKNLATCPNDDALKLLVQLTRDKVSEVRGGAVEAIVVRKGRSAFEAIAEIINEDSFAYLSADDQQNLLKAFSILGSDAAVSFLVGLVTQYNLFGNHSRAYFRLAALEALCHNRGEKAELTLIRLASSWRPDIKKQAAMALQRRRGIIYGSSDE